MSVNTSLKKSDIPCYNNQTNSFSKQDQINIRHQNAATIYHENIHYAHEVSTSVGITTFSFEFINRSLFAKSANVPETSLSVKVTGIFRFSSQNQLQFRGFRGSSIPSETSLGYSNLFRFYCRMNSTID